VDQEDLARRNAARVLVADDNLDAAESLATLLEFHGYQVQFVHDGESALQALETFRPDVALLDIGMPKLDGYEVACRARQTSWGAKLKLIALTGWGHDQARRDALAAGFDRHFVKPVAIEELLAYLQSLAN
jgi:CheY-like chemotaxis protein